MSLRCLWANLARLQLKVVECRCVHRKEGHTVEVRVTYEEKDTERFTAEALDAESGCDAIVTAGGDGSINQV